MPCTRFAALSGAETPGFFSCPSRLLSCLAWFCRSGASPTLKIILLPVVLTNLNALALYGMPPSVLLLGSSRWECVRLFNLIERGIYPYRIVVLLEPSLTGPLRHSRSHWIHFEVDNLRIVGRHSWRDVVAHVSASVPLVVLDTRLASPAVVEETRRMLEEPFRTKALFVVADDGSSPSVAAAQPSRSLSDLRSARLTEVVSTLKAMGLTETTSPDDNPLLARASYLRNSKKIGRAMIAVAQTGVPLGTALDTADRVHGLTPFVTAAHSLQGRLNGNPGDGALEVFAQLTEDIAATESFITQWTPSTELEYQAVIARSVAVHHALCSLQKAVDCAPPVFLQWNQESLRSMTGKKA